MSQVKLIEWDSRLLGLQVGRALGTVPPNQDELDCYNLVLARLPVNDHDAIECYQEIGFNYIALDITLLVSQPVQNKSLEETNYSIFWHSHEPPPFLIEGFCIDDSRLMIDKYCRQRLASNFWDSMVIEHCSEYADMVACALDTNNNQLVGFISCFLRESTLELFMVSVHPDFQNQGIGKAMLKFVATKAQKIGCTLSTQVLASNTNAINFYINFGFRVDRSDVILHRWKEKK